jgi:predicted house-cleaning noncanonical NTP pyrophosphatase (MazG superfamily)
MGKLVRDRIPEIMRQQGQAPVTETISGERLRRALKDKLVEEAEELRHEDDITEELADVLEVIEALIEAYGLDKGAIETVKAEKKLKRGDFSEGQFLHE